ncbi:MAG TPA: ABC transporter permease [Gammaproteobacteria bacterium]|nr:ABC transporter permease [Gammaproteobacteria bacterium]
MNGFLKDLRFGLRQLVAKPGFAAAAILTLALGIGANTAMFSVLSGYLLKPLPYPDGSRLVQVDAKFLNLPSHDKFPGMGMPLYFEVKDRAHSLTDAALYRTDAFGLQASGRAQRVVGTTTTASLFSVLGVKPLLGKVFGADNEEGGRSQMVVLSYHLWQSVFGGSADAIGKTIELDSRVYRVAGVMPRGFAFPDRDTDLWRPLVITAANRDVQRFGPLNYDMIGRLRPGANLARLTQELKGTVDFVHRSLSADDWRQVKGLGFTMTAGGYRQALLGDQTTTLLLLQVAVLLVLLIACVNVANLLLSRTLGRSHELTVRTALGASRAVLARQMLIEALCLSVPGGLIGIGLGWWALALIGRSGLVASGEIFNLAPDWRVGVFAFVVVTVTAILVSLAPIHRLSRTDLQALLQEGGRRTGGGRRARGMRNALVVVELVLATGMLAGAGLLLHSFINLQSARTGFDKQNVLAARLLIPRNDHAGDAALASFFDSVLQRVKSMPGVSHAAVATCVPLCPTGIPGEYVRMHGYKPPQGAPTPTAGMIAIGGDYFKTLGIPILRGRTFNAGDTANGQPVAIVDQVLAQRYFSGTDPIGQQIAISETGKWYTIVGIVPSIKVRSVEQQRNQPMVYISLAQWPQRSISLALKTTVSPAAMTKPLTSLMRDLDPAIAVYDVRTMQSRLAGALQNQRATMLLVIAFGAIALALAMIGVYGVMSYAVGQRRAECGVRLALGAHPDDLLWLILRDGLRLLAVGLAAGLSLAILFGYVISTRLFGVLPFDPVTLVGSAIVLCIITLAACYLPAKRAAKVDPAAAMTEQ